MKKKLLFSLALLLSLSVYSQTDKFWSPAKSDHIIVSKNIKRLSFPAHYDLYTLNFDALKQNLYAAPDRFENKKGIVITLPNVKGNLERFEMFEASNFDAELQQRFPEIRAYVGLGLDDVYAQLRLSISPQGIQTMVFRADGPNEFMEPYSEDARIYAVYQPSRDRGSIPFTCSTVDTKFYNETLPQVQNTNRSSKGQLKTLRLAQSCNGEYAAYFGASTAGTSADTAKVLAAFNATLTRCNGVYEKDLAVHLSLISTTTSVIYYNKTTDPYTTLSSWNQQLQTALTSKIGSANYDIGHMFGASGGGGNAGCIGCICVDPTTSTPLGKGSGITSPADGIPMGDNFDIDYVVHEVGHQMGGNHTFSNSSEGTGVNMEVGSGITIMGYAGITSQDVAPHSIAYYHAATINQIQTNLITKSCPTTTTLTNVAPVVNAGADYTIPKSTPFKLTGSATDANGDPLTYSWEQYDDCGTQTGANSAALIGKIVGPNWISYNPSSSPSQYFPVITTVIANAQTTSGTGDDGIDVEALSSVARTLNFRLTCRDNVATAGQTNFDDMKVTVDATKGPLRVTSQAASGISYAINSTQTVNWSVASTNSLSANVDILLSTDGGYTYPTTVVSGIPNNGAATITIPVVVPSTTCRFMVRASSNIFFNINTTNFAITPDLNNQNFNLAHFSLYPNPNQGSFTVQFEPTTSNDITIMVHDLRGRIIFNKKYFNTGLFNQKIELDHAESGIYLVTTKEGDNQVVKKITIN